MKKILVLVFSMAFCFISINGQTEKKDPLIVVNGKISNIKLSSLNPNDIESIAVSKSAGYKDAYGILAENGVISITTKDYIKTESQNDQPAKPLVFVDGEVYTNSLDSLSVDKIQSVSVRKDKSAINLYGKAGENGVILITTKERAFKEQ
jgi:TonB-dependent SusC/RagA subfamily outer membrane receptor